MTDSATRLLIVDDEKSVRDFLAKVARQLGFDVATAGNHERIRQKLTSFMPSVIILDLQMPGCDGIQTLKLLKDLSVDAQVILISGTDTRTLETATNIGEILKLKMAGVLQKPVLIDTLRAALNKVQDARANIYPSELEKAIKNGEIRPVYQPKAAKNARGGWTIAEAEALARWHRDDSVVILPSEFIGLAEESGLLPSLTQSMLRQIIPQLSSWEAQGIQITVAVNVSPSLLLDTDFPDQLDALMQENGLENSRLILELTESAAMQNASLATEVLTRLRIKGFGLSIDDFGTGYSSLEQLYRMPFNELKIDRFLVRDIGVRSEAATIVEAIIALGHKLNLSICAEGVETLDVLTHLLDSGCDKFQGYVIGKPTCAENFEKYIRSFAPTSTAAHNRIGMRTPVARHNKKVTSSSLPLLCS